MKVDSTPATVANMYSTQKNSITISLTVNMWHKTTKIEALLDCGATHNFIDPRTIKSLAMGTNPLKQALTVHNVDGTINQGGTISQYCNLWVRRGKHVEKLGFYVANLGRDRLILGYPWFTKFNPDFDWKNNILEGEEVEIDMAGYRNKIATTLRTVNMTLESDETEKKNILGQIPAAYHQYWEVFSERASYRFPLNGKKTTRLFLRKELPTKLTAKYIDKLQKNSKPHASSSLNP